MLNRLFQIANRHRRGRAAGPGLTVVLTLAFGLVLSAPVLADRIEHKLSFPEAASHYIQLESRFPVRDTGLELKMAQWTPGSYKIRNYARHVDSIEALDGRGRPLEIQRIGLNRWRIPEASEQVIVSYRLYAREVTVRTNWVDSDFAVLNGAATFLVPVSGLGMPHRLTLDLPKPWPDVATALPEISGRVFEARDFHHLVDSPIVAGPLSRHHFRVGGRDHELVNVGHDQFWDVAGTVEDLKVLFAFQHEFWGEFPYDGPYLILNVISGTGGGLEHAESTLLMSRPLATRTRSDYLDWLRLVSHELFHVWNHKQFRPRALMPFDYEQAMLFDELWIVEGITSYYDDLMLVRAGLMDTNEYLAQLARVIHEVASTPGQAVRSLVEASRETWLKFYLQDENWRNVDVNYYRKGALAAFYLDMLIREATRDRRSLDDVMRAASRRFPEFGYDNRLFLELADEVAGTSVSRRLWPIIEQAMPIDLTESLARVGLEIREITPEEGVDLGIAFEPDREQLIVAVVLEGRPAAAGGINAEDELIAIDGMRVTRDSIEEVLTRLKPGGSAPVLLNRRGRIIERSMPLVPPLPASLRLEEVESPTRGQRRALQRWLAP